MKFPASVAVALLCWVSAALGAQRGGMPGLDDKWKRLESPHFELFCHVSEGDGRELLRNLELLQAVFGNVIRAKEQRPNPLTIYFFRNDQEFLPYVSAPIRSAQRTAGFFLHRPDRSVIVLSPAWTSEGQQRLIMHEFVHHLLNATGDEPAVWYGEGMAELLSTIEERKDHVLIGTPIAEHVVELRQRELLSLDSLFAANHGSNLYNETRRVGMFYAQSWAMLHYWYCGQQKLTAEQKAKRDAFLHFVRRRSAEQYGRTREEIFKEMLGLDFEQMLRRLRSYVERGTYMMFKVPLPEIPPQSSYTVRRVDRGEMALHLANLDLRVNRSGAAKLALLDAIGRNPSDVRSLEVLGTEAWADGSMVEARERWSQAVAAGTTNPAIYHELAAMEANRWFASFDPYFRLPTATAEQLRDLLARSIERVPQQAQAYEIMAWVEATAAQPQIANINVVQQRIGQVKDRPRTLLALGLVRARFKDYATARQIIGELEKDAASPGIASDAKVLRAYVDRQDPPAEGS